jgi:ADP-ribose pyrophosphatase
MRVEREREIYRGRVIRLVVKDLRLPNGRRTTFNIIEHPGAVAIVPVFDNGDVMLIRQFRPSINREIYEIPAGTLEDGEKPLQTARREIVEETGYRARHWSKVGEFYTAPGFCNERIHVYAARGLEPARADGDADEMIRPARMPLRRAIEMIRKGTIRDAKSIAGLLLYHGRR